MEPPFRSGSIESEPGSTSQSRTWGKVRTLGNEKVLLEAKDRSIRSGVNTPGTE